MTRLRIARALEGETLQQLSERTRNELEVVFTGVLNGLYASTPLAHRTPIKIGIAEPYLPRPRETAEDAGAKDGGETAEDAGVDATGRVGGDAPPGDEPDEGGTGPRAGTAPGGASR